MNTETTRTQPVNHVNDQSRTGQIHRSHDPEVLLGTHFIPKNRDSSCDPAQAVF